MKKMINFVKPTITVAHGAIAGAGTSLLLAGDIALVSDDAMFMVAFGAVGLIPDCAGHWLLPRACGLNMAKELMMTQRAVKAPEMKELGLCNHVYPKEQLMDEAMKLANKIAKGPLNCYSSSKLILNKSFETNLEDLLKEETEAQAAAVCIPMATRVWLHSWRRERPTSSKLFPFPWWGKTGEVCNIHTK